MLFIVMLVPPLVRLIPEPATSVDADGPLIDTVPAVVLIARPPATEYVGPPIVITLLVVLFAPVVVLCDK
jgi:hypothetical protein